MSTDSSSVKTSLALSPRFVKTVLLGLALATSAVWFGSRWLLSANFLPHWYCLAGNRRLLWTTVIADVVVGLSYVVISATLIWLVHRAGRNLPYTHFFWAFGLFIVSCGASHFLEVLTVWYPVYWLAAAVKVVTAISSAGTAFVLAFASGDIAEFVRTAREAAARRGNEKFRALIEALPTAVVSTDFDNRILVWNPAAERTFGWSAREVLGSQLTAIPAEKLEEYQELRRRARAGDATHSLETIRITRDGTRFPASVSVAPVFDEDGSVTSLLAVVEDITGRKRIKRDLREKGATLSAVTQALNTFLDTGDWSAASQFLLDFALRQTQSQYGFLGVVLEGPVLRVLAHSGVAWHPTLDRELYEEKKAQHLAHGHFEIRHEQNLLGEVILNGKTVVSNSPDSDRRSGGLPAGHPPMTSFLGVPIFKGKETVGLIAVANREGGYTGSESRYLETISQATGVLYDSYRQSIRRSALEAEQKRLEDQVRQAQKMEVLGRLAGGVAHDFNNMLMVLDGSSELLERIIPPDSGARLYLDQIRRATERAAAVTKQLLAFSRKQVLELRPTDLHEALDESESMLPRLLGSDIELTFHHDASRSWILADPAQIQQVVANLTINSRDAMPGGGQLTISTRNAAQLPEDGADGNKRTTEWVVLEVADTGCGMDEKTRAQIFEPFFTTKAPGKGTGLGLASVYGIVKQSGGHIRVDTALGKGTRFELYFPVVEAVTSAPAPPVQVESGGNDGGGATILVADDEAALRHAVVELLRSSGYNVLEANSALAAVDIARQHTGKIEVLLTDIVMPGLRGDDLARRVASFHPGVQVIYMSGYAEGFPEAEIPANAVFLQKPFRFATLLEQLKLMRRAS